MNNLYSVQLLDYASGTCTIVGMFRDENTAIMFQNDKNNELESHGKSLPKGEYVIRPIYTDF